jgi:6-phosphogluconate dehydrogenase
MRIAISGLGRMGANMAHRLRRGGIEVVGLNRTQSVVEELAAEALGEDQVLANIAPYVADSGEGRWTAIEAIDQGVATPVMTLALHARFSSQDDQGYGNRLLSMMRNAFGGHAVKKSGG